MSKPKKFLDPQQLLSDIVSSGFDLSRFQDIDESHMPTPENFLDWITGRDFCNATLLPWQIEAGIHLFSDYCPNLGNGPAIPPCSNQEYLHELFDEPTGEILDNVELLKEGVCPKCHKNRLDLFSLGNDGTGRPSIKSEFVGNLGQRSGKSKFAVSACSYQMVRWLKYPNALEFYGLPNMEVVVGEFCALSSDQAERNLWIPFKGLYDQAPWFKKYNEFLKEEEQRLSIPLANIKDTFIFYPHKRFMCEFSGSDDRKKRGATRLFGVIDEIAYLNSEQGTSKKKIMDADKNYAALSNSLETMMRKVTKKLGAGHYNALMPIMYNVSSPYNVQDKIMRLTKGGANNPLMVVIHRSTWEANPDYDEKSLRLSKSGLSQVEFERDFGAIPPYSDSPYIGEVRVMERLAMKTKPEPVVETTREVFNDPMGDRYLYLKARMARFDKSRPRLLALDNGYNQNAFAACLFSYDFKEKRPILDFAVSLYPDKEAGLHIHFPKMFDHFVLPLVTGLHIKHVFYDRWQSLDQIHRLREKKVNALAHSLSFEKDLLPFKQMLVSGNMVIPPIETPIDQVKNAIDPLALAKDQPITNLVWQTLTVRESGRKLLKPLEGDDDIFRAFALGGSRFLVDEIAKQYVGYSGVRGAMGNVGYVGTYHSNSGARSGGSAQVSRQSAIPGKGIGWMKYKSRSTK